MLPGVDFTEMLLLAVVAMVLLGPRDLPLMMRKIGRFTGKMRALAFEFKQGFDELGRQAELEELRKEVAELKKHTGVEDLQKEFEEDRINLEKDINSAMGPDEPAKPKVEPKIAPPSHAGLSPEHPGYDTGESADDGELAEADAETDAESATPAEPVAPAKQDASA